MLPHDFPPWSTAYGKFREWQLDGTWERVHAHLREDVRIEAGVPRPRKPCGSTARRSRPTHRGGPDGWDGGKKTTGRKRFIGVESFGLVWAGW